MSRSLALSLALLTLSLVASGCSKKAPVAPTAAPAASTSSQGDVGRAPAPPPRADDAPTVDPLAERDLQRLNAYLAKEGLLGDVFFAFDRHDLDGPTRDRLERNARFLADHPDLVVQIEGHCDERGTNEYNLALGSRRANAATDFVRTAGVSAARLRPMAIGEENPACHESRESCWSRNRRARFVVVDRVN